MLPAQHVQDVLDVLGHLVLHRLLHLPLVHDLEAEAEDVLLDLLKVICNTRGRIRFKTSSGHFKEILLRTFINIRRELQEEREGGREGGRERGKGRQKERREGSEGGERGGGR